MPKNICLSLLVLLGLGFAGSAAAEPPATQAAASVPVKGKVAVTASQEAKITAATLTADDGAVYNLVMDTVGEDLARVMFGQPAQILGTISEQQGKKWLKVTGFPNETAAAAHELWRRTRCNACAIQKGTTYAAEPKDLQGALPVTGRQYPYKQQFRSVTRDDKYLWLATDRLIYQIDLAARQLLKTYDRSIGLGDEPLLEIASDGKTLWILSRGSAYALPIGQDRVFPLSCWSLLHFKFARLYLDGSQAWIIADNGTYRFTAAQEAPQELPAIPTGKRMAAEIDKGILLLSWKRDTASYLAQPVAIGGNLYVSSYGDVYELADGVWNKLVEGAGQLQARKGRLWVLTSAGLVEYDPKTKTKMTYLPQEIADGRFTGLSVTETDAWVTAEPVATPKGDNYVGGGVARLSLSTKEWQCWKKIDGLDATHTVLQPAPEGTGIIWMATHQGSYQTLAAHPGMTYVTKILFAATGFGLHRWNCATGKWLTLPLAYTNFEKRFICGQDGQGAEVEIGPQNLDRLCIGPDTIFASDRLRPVGSFSGYWPCVDQVATCGADDQWSAKFEHHPQELNLQGEQPLVLNISNKGEMVLEAVGHDNVLDLFLQDGRFWAVTESWVGWFDAGQKTWQKVAELGYNFYWRPTAILDEGDEVYIGSDRGLVSRLNLKTGRCEIFGGLKNRLITGLARHGGKLVVFSGQAPLGLLPLQLKDMPNLVDADAASWDGKTWQAIHDVVVDEEVVPATQPLPAWYFKPMGEPPKQRPPFLRDQMIGNMLCGPAPDGTVGPRYYIKEVYAPRLLTFSPDGHRMWLSIFGGLLQADLPTAEKTK